jgi:hypothetical protein
MTEKMQADGKVSKGKAPPTAGTKACGGGESAGGAYDSDTASKPDGAKPADFLGTGGQSVQEYHGPDGPNTVTKK